MLNPRHLRGAGVCLPPSLHGEHPAALPMGSSSSSQPCIPPGGQQAKDNSSRPLRSQVLGTSTGSSLPYPFPQVAALQMDSLAI